MTLKTERSTKYPACKGGQKSTLHKNTQKRKASDRNFESIGQTPFFIKVQNTQMTPAIPNGRSRLRDLCEARRALVS